MAGSSFFALLDDIASVMDDVAILSKVAAKKTSGVIGDDLALNANQVVGLSSSRELPVVYQVAKGSLINKIIIVPSAILISLIFPIIIKPLLMIGGLFLCFEGVEKILHSTLSSKKEKEEKKLEHIKNLQNSVVDLITLEKEKIKGAIRTDFILSAEIVVISLGLVSEKNILTQAMVLSLIGIGMTIFVYGLVAIIVKIDDFGFFLLSKGKLKKLGEIILIIAPYLMKFLSIVGTAAMFFVGGSILTHGNSNLVTYLNNYPALAPIIEALIGVCFGTLAVFIIFILKKLKNKLEHD